MTPASSKPCPCTSGTPYRACCGPYHALAAEPPDARALMRSRYAAFVVRQAEYLHRTLHPDHEDRLCPRDEALRDIRDTCQANRYQGLTILDDSGPDEAGAAHVLFLARVFHRGRDLSFVERSEFRRAEGGWRYLRGDLHPLAVLGAAARGLTLERFAALIG